MQPPSAHPRPISLAMAAGALLVSWIASGCGGKGPVLTPDPTGEALYEQGQEELAKEHWHNAADIFDTVLKNYPSSPHLAEARLGLGQANYEIGRPETYIIAIDAFQSFLTYHPSHPRADYAQYMIGMSYVAQMRAADRDQTETKKAVEAFEQFLEVYPNSDLLAEAQRQLNRARDRLADSEYRIARWQLSQKYYDAARARANDALETFPATGSRCSLLFVLGETYYLEGKDRQEAVRYYQEIVDQHPDCRYAARAEKRLLKLDSSQAS
ncbi:MAG: outer membrane protein assembly factor BamD [Acidobacteriota bacterium]